MNKILWLSDSPFTNTGYSTISRNVLNGVSDEFETHFQGHNYIGQALPPGVTLKDGFTFKFTVYGTGREGYCKDVTIPRIQTLKPNVYVVLLDTFMLYPWVMDMNFAPAKSVFYFPSDGGGGLPQDCDRLLRHFDVAVAMSKFGQQQAKEVHGLNVEYIPHAVDHNNYRPLSKIEKEIVRREMLVLSVTGVPMRGYLADKFVVGVVARNQGRKMLDRTIKAFAEFCKDKPNAVLFMHSDPYDAAAIFDITFLIRRYHLENRVCFSNARFFENLDYKDMNKVYNVMDVFLLSTSGEGFGIPIIEAMSCEIPVVATDYTTTKELIIDDGICGISVPISAEITGSWNVERAVISVPETVEALNTYFRSTSLRVEHGRNGREKVLRQYSWDVVIPQWKELFRRLSA